MSIIQKNIRMVSSFLIERQKNNMVNSLLKMDKGKIIILSILFFSLLMETLISSFNFPGFIRYLNDILLLISSLMSLEKIGTFFTKKVNRKFLIGVFIYLFVSLFSSILNLVNPMLLIWAFRNTFRGIIYMVIVASNFNSSDIKKIMNSLVYVQIINVILAIYQFTILGHAQDYIGGIFGYGNGAGVNTFNALLISYFLAGYLEGKESIIKTIIVILTSFIIAAIAEEKATYIYFLIIIFPVLILSKASLKRKFKILFTGLVGLFLGLALLKFIYPDMFYNLVNINKFKSYLTATYDGGYELPRVGFFSKINSLVFENSFIKSIIGIGFGNAENSNFSVFQSDFYNQYGYLHYRWFVGQWLYIEQGYIGFIAYVMMFISIIYLLIKNLKFNKNYLNVVGVSITLCLIASIFYNSTLKSDMSYLAYFGIAIGIIGTKSNYSEEKEIESDTNKSTKHIEV